MALLRAPYLSTHRRFIMKTILTPIVLVATCFAPMQAKADITTSVPTTTEAEKKTYITLQEMLLIAQTITKDVDGELTWSAVPKIMHLSSQMVNDTAHLPKDVRNQAIVQVINQVIDLTDTPFLPDKLTDPLFKAMVPAFVDVFADDDVLSGLSFDITDEMTANKNYEAIGKAIIKEFSDSFEWKDLLFALKVAMKFANTMENATQDTRAEMIKHVLHVIVDEVDIPKFPDAIADPIIKLFLDELVDEFKQYL